MRRHGSFLFLLFYVSLKKNQKYEQIYRGTPKEVLQELNEIKGEFVIVVEYKETTDNYEDISIKEHVEKYIKDGYKTMDAIKVVSKERSIPKGEVYNEYHKEK